MAKSAAKAPVAKSPASPSRPLHRARTPFQAGGSRNSNSPAMPAASNPTITRAKTRKLGLWNWRPQPTATPEARSAIRTLASAPMNAMTPAADAKNPTRIRFDVWSALFTAAFSLIVRTGRTHGIKLRTAPPRTARNTNQIRSDASAAALVRSKGGGGATSAGRSVVVKARAPSVTVRSGATAGTFPSKGMLAHNRLPASESRRSGRPNEALSAHSGNTLGASKGCSEASDTMSALPSAERPERCTVTPSTAASEGTRPAHSDTRSALGSSMPEPGPSVSARSNVSGTQTREQTSNDTFARIATGSPGRSSVTSSGRTTRSA